MRDEGRFDRVLGLAREAELLRLARVEATRVRSHRADFPRRAAALLSIIALTLSAGPALLLAGSGLAATTAGVVVAANLPHLPTAAVACCVVRHPRELVVVEARRPAVRAVPKAKRSSPSPSPATPAAPPTPAPPTPAPTDLQAALPALPVASSSPSASPSSPSPSASASPSFRKSASPTPAPSVSSRAGHGCAAMPT